MKGLSFKFVNPMGFSCPLECGPQEQGPLGEWVGADFHGQLSPNIVRFEVQGTLNITHKKVYKTRPE